MHWGLFHVPFGNSQRQDGAALSSVMSEAVLNQYQSQGFLNKNCLSLALTGTILLCSGSPWQSPLGSGVCPPQLPQGDGSWSQWDLSTPSHLQAKAIAQHFAQWLQSKGARPLVRSSAGSSSCDN